MVRSCARVKRERERDQEVRAADAARRGRGRGKGGSSELAEEREFQPPRLTIQQQLDGAGEQEPDEDERDWRILTDLSSRPPYRAAVSEPPPSAEYSAAATVANFCGSVNSFIASGFRTEMAFGARVPESDRGQAGGGLREAQDDPDLFRA